MTRSWSNAAHETRLQLCQLRCLHLPLIKRHALVLNLLERHGRDKGSKGSDSRTKGHQKESNQVSTIELFHAGTSPSDWGFSGTAFQSAGVNEKKAGFSVLQRKGIAGTHHCVA